MWLDLELCAVSLHDADEFGSLKVVAKHTDHVWLTREEISRLAGDRGSDPNWQAALDRMLAYAESRGWLDDHGAVRAHVEWVDER